MANISCYLISQGNFKPVRISEELLLELCINLRNKGLETVQFKDNKIIVEGVYVPARGSNINLIVLPDTEE